MSGSKDGGWGVLTCTAESKVEIPDYFGIGAPRHTIYPFPTKPRNNSPYVAMRPAI